MKIGGLRVQSYDALQPWQWAALEGMELGRDEFEEEQEEKKRQQNTHPTPELPL